MPIQDFPDNNLINTRINNFGELQALVRICLKPDCPDPRDQRCTFILRNKMPIEDLQVYQNIKTEFQRCWGLSQPCAGVSVLFEGQDPGSFPPVDCFGLSQAPTLNLFHPGVEPLPTPPGELPLVVFYYGNGAGLLVESQPPTIPPTLVAQPQFAANYDQKISFFYPQKRAVYLFVDSIHGAHEDFSHELGHVLGLSDRNLDGVDESKPNGTNPALYVQEPARRTVPMSANYVASVLQGVGENDTQYQPQLNLMSSFSCRLTNFQRNVIRQRKIEPTYPPGRVLFLANNNDAKRLLNPQPPPCRLNETEYLDSFPIDDNLTRFQTPAGIQQHNTFRRDPAAPQGYILQNGFQVQGANRVNRNEWNQLLSAPGEINGPTLRLLRALEDIIR